LKVFEKIMYPILVIYLLMAIYYSKNNQSFYQHIVHNDQGLFQWTTFATLLFASFMCFYRASILRPFRGPVFSMSQKLLGWIFLFFAFDEVSWLQKFFNFKSPAFFVEYNIRQEMNFHNLILYGYKINAIVFTLAIKIIATIYFLILPFLYHKMSRVKKFVNNYGIPLPRYTQTFAYLIMAVLVGMITDQNSYVVFELGFYWLLVLLMYNPINDEVFSRKSLVR